MPKNFYIKDERQFLYHLKKLTRIFKTSNKISNTKISFLEDILKNLNYLEGYSKNKYGLKGLAKSIFLGGKFKKSAILIQNRLQRFDTLLNRQDKISNMEIQVFKKDETTLERILQHKILSRATNSPLSKLIKTLILKERQNVIDLLRKYKEYRERIAYQSSISKEIAIGITEDKQDIANLINKTNDCIDSVKEELNDSDSMNTLFNTLLQETKNTVEAEETIKENKKLHKVGGQQNMDLGQTSKELKPLIEQEDTRIKQNLIFLEGTQIRMDRIKKKIGFHWFFQDEFEKFHSSVEELREFVKKEDEELLTNDFNGLKEHFKQMKGLLPNISNLYSKELEKIEKDISDPDYKTKLERLSSEIKNYLVNLVGWIDSGLSSIEVISEITNSSKVIKQKNNLITIINNITNILNETLKKGLALVSLEKKWEKFSKGEKLEPVSKIQIVGKLNDADWTLSHIQNVIVELGGKVITADGSHPYKIIFDKHRMPLGKSTPPDLLVSEVSEATGKDGDILRRSFSKGKLLST